MAQFRKKPVVIEAVQYNGMGDFAKLELTKLLAQGSREVEFTPDCLFIKTLEGVMRADPGDWIIKGVKGELYPCKPEIFEATYDPVNP